LDIRVIELYLAHIIDIFIDRRVGMIRYLGYKKSSQLIQNIYNISNQINKCINTKMYHFCNTLSWFLLFQNSCELCFFLETLYMYISFYKSWLISSILFYYFLEWIHLYFRYTVNKIQESKYGKWFVSLCISYSVL
jgi:hypothetical protein